MHTLGTWQNGPANEHGESSVVAFVEGEPTSIICQVVGGLAESPANAEFIVRSCNAHDALVEALERTLTWLTSYQGHGTMGPDGPYEQARAALKQATGES